MSDPGDHHRKEERRPSSSSKAPSQTPVAENDATSELSVDSYTTLQEGIAELVVKDDLQHQLQPTRSDSEIDAYPGVERSFYDYEAERRDPYPNNILESTAHILKGSLGVGLLSIHEAYMHGGLWTSLAINIVLGIIATYNMLLLAKSAQKMYVRLRIPRLSYPDLVEAVVATGPIKCIRPSSKICRYTMDLMLFIQTFGSCCIYQVIIATTAKHVFEEVSSTMDDKRFSLSIYVIMLSLPVMLLSMIRSLKYLVPLSFVADIFVVVCIVVTLYRSFAAGGKISERHAWRSFSGMLHASGACIYSMDGLTHTLHIENQMAKPRYISVVVHIAMPIIILATAIMGFVGYWAWGEECQVPVTTNMPLHLEIIIIQFLLTAVLIVTFTFRFWMLFKIVYRYACRRIKIHTQHGYYERIMRLTIVTFITCVSVAYPNIDQMISFLGNFFLAPVTFVVPALIETFVSWTDLRPGSQKGRWNTYRCVHLWSVFNIALGLFLCGGGLYNLIAGDVVSKTIH